MPSRAELVELAVKRLEGQNGYAETACNSSTMNNTKFGVWYGMNCSAWCAMFVSWGFAVSGLPLSASAPKGFAYTPSGVAWFKQKGAWAGPDTNPQRGWVVFFYSESAERVAHVGVVRGPRGSDGLIPIVEGNTNGAGSPEGGSVMFKRRSPSQSLSFRIAGYGRPDLIPEEVLWMANLTEAEQREVLTAARQINGAVGEGQTSFQTTIESTLATVQALVNEGRSQSTALGKAMASSDTAQTAAILAAIKADTTTVDLSPEDQAELAAKIKEMVPATDPDDLVDALANRLAS